MNRGWIRPFLSFLHLIPDVRLYMRVFKKKKKSLQPTRTNSGQSGTTNHRRGGKSVGVDAGCVLFFFFLKSTEIPTNAMLCHTIPYHTILEITFPPLTALLGDSPLLLSAYSVSAARCHERTRAVTSVLSRTTFNPRIAASASLALGKKEPRIFRISIYVRMGVLVIGLAMYCTVQIEQKEK